MSDKPSEGQAPEAAAPPAAAAPSVDFQAIVKVNADLERKIEELTRTGSEREAKYNALQGSIALERRDASIDRLASAAAPLLHSSPVVVRALVRQEWAAIEKVAVPEGAKPEDVAKLHLDAFIGRAKELDPNLLRGPSTTGGGNISSGPASSGPAADPYMLAAKAARGVR